jgi:hypothetical protein
MYQQQPVNSQQDKEKTPTGEESKSKAEEGEVVQ